jgi:cytochrome c oxidase cbb3-type subunit 2
MAFNIHTSHKLIFFLPAGIYLLLVFGIAILPALEAQRQEDTYEVAYVTPNEAWGRELYRESFNCVVCHTQQIRGQTQRDGSLKVLDADARLGLETATTAIEYAHQEAPLLGTQRTGPDLSSVGIRLPGAQWHFWHLYDPRSVSPDSTMEAYPFLFTREKPQPENGVEPLEVERIEALGITSGQLWATPRAVALVDYLLSLRRERRVK